MLLASRSRGCSSSGGIILVDLTPPKTNVYEFQEGSNSILIFLLKGNYCLCFLPEKNLCFKCAFRTYILTYYRVIANTHTIQIYVIVI